MAQHRMTFGAQHVTVVFRAGCIHKQNGKNKY